MIAVYCDFDGVINFFGDAELRDPERQFADIKTGQVPHPRKNGEVHYTQLQWSNELVKRMNSLTKEHDVEFIWLTAWRSSGMTILKPMTNLNASRTILWEWFEDDYSHKYKLHGLVDDLKVNEYEAFVWIDDFAADGWRDRDNFPRGIPSLVIEPVPGYGISRLQMQRIEEFVDKVESSRTS